MENEGEEVQVEQAEAAPVVEAETQPEVAEQEAPAETQPGEPERIEASADEARQNNYIPYDRFKSVVEERNDMRSKLDEQQRVLSMFRPGVQQQQQSEPEQSQQESYYDREDPGQVALNKLNQLEARMQADRHAADIERQVTKHVQDMGFADTDRAAQKIHKEIVWALNTSGNLPDLEQVARDLRQEEIELTRRVVRGYEEKKTSPSARAAAPRPPSPPVVQSTEARSPDGLSSRSALDRVLGALRSGR